ncbi:hypothetical protein [Rhodococcus globerulus]|uniref:DNA polymerase III subunit beta family protein n=1 Tax=Rhodococcus globerulus TaxID=33008 RepID=UPI003015B60B
MNTLAFTADSALFARLIETAALFAGEDSTLPMLAAVRLERHDNELLAIGTDRFRLGCVRINVKWDDQAPADWATLITREDVAQIITSYKPKGKGRRVDDLAVGVRPSPDRPTTCQLVLTKAGSSITLTIDPLDEGFPKWRGLLKTSVAATSAPLSERTAVLNLDLLKTFEKVKWSTNDSLNIEYGTDPSRPVTITCGQHFLGIQMPIREQDRSAWDAVLESSNLPDHSLGLELPLVAA